MFKTHYESYLNLVEQELRNLPLDEGILCESMFYSLLGGGKRVRPVLALACIDIVGGEPSKFAQAAVSLEMIHTYSLIHDDLPAMDNDDLRRGKPSNHKKYGETTAILAGDALLTYAFEILAKPLPVPAEKQLRVIRETAQAAGWQGMAGGQALDTASSFENSDLTMAEYIHNMKTGALLRASARLGAVLGGGTEEEIDLLSQYAAYLGLAFQIKDDILDIIGENITLGKPAGSDQKLDKPTYPSLLGLEGAQDKLTETIVAAKNMLASFGERGRFLDGLADYIVQRNC